MMKSVMSKSITQRLRDVLLAGDFFKSLRSPFSGDYLIGHYRERFGSMTDFRLVLVGRQSEGCRTDQVSEFRACGVVYLQQFERIVYEAPFPVFDPIYLFALASAFH